jgi:hypothetical protein
MALFGHGLNSEMSPLCGRRTDIPWSRRHVLTLTGHLPIFEFDDTQLRLLTGDRCSIAPPCRVLDKPIVNQSMDLDAEHARIEGGTVTPWRHGQVAV